MNNKMVVSMIGKIGVIQHIELNEKDVREMCKMGAMGFYLLSGTHKVKLEEIYEEINKYMSSLSHDEQDEIFEKYWINENDDLNRILEIFNVKTYKIYSTEEYVSTFGKEVLDNLIERINKYC